MSNQEELNNALRVDNVSYRYADCSTLSLDNVSFSLPMGSRMLLIGANGSGKSTLLNVVRGLHLPSIDAKRLNRVPLDPSTNRVCVLGHDPFRDTSFSVQCVAYIGGPWPDAARWGNCTVESHLNALPAALWKNPREVAWKDALLNVLRVEPTWRIDHCSEGQRRRVQILLNMIPQRRVVLLDEGCNDMDAVDRRRFLNFLRTQCEEDAPVGNEKVLCAVIFATHIYDDLQGATSTEHNVESETRGTGSWATHVGVLQMGRLIDFKSIVGNQNTASSLTQKVEVWDRCVEQWISHAYQKSPESSVQMDKIDQVLTKSLRENTGSIAVAASGFTWCHRNPNAFPQACSQQRRLFQSVSFSIPRGARVLVVGRNGSGKSTLVQLLSGMLFIAAPPAHQKEETPPALTVLDGRPCFHDTTLVRNVVLCGLWWREGEPEWNMTVRELLTSLPTRTHESTEHQPPLPLEQDLRVLALLELFEVCLDWRVRSVSSGERKRIQLVVRLRHPRDLYLLDEATSDLDLIQRRRLLKFLHRCCSVEGATVLYATHILSDVGWADRVLLIHRSAGRATLWPTPWSETEHGLGQGDALDQRERYQQVLNDILSELETDDATL